MKPLVSVIVPIYKVEAYIEECIDSVLSQTFKNFELILVDDGSPDNCGAICDAYAAKDSRIQVIHQRNQGVTRARANGVAAAQGKFITFVDGDDTLLPEALATMLKPADDETDVVLAKYAGAPCPPAGELSLDEYRKHFAVMKGVIVGPFAKLFRRTLFNDYIFDLPPELRVGEDAVMNIRLAYRAQGKIYCTDSVVYVYRDNELSAMHTHKVSPESDMLLQRYRLDSIPPEEVSRLLPEGLADSLIHHWINATLESVILPTSTKAYHQYLLSIEKYSSLTLPFYPGFILHCHNAVLRFAVIHSRKLLKKLFN